MVIKKTPAMPVIYFTTTTTLNDIGKFVGTVAKQLYEAAAKQELLPSGPLQWVYTGADGKPDTIFTLEIALPVTGVPKDQSPFLFKELPAFECITTLHHGNWEHLHEAYDCVIGDCYANGKKLSGVCREQYIYMDFIHPENNLTEVQVGI